MDTNKMRDISREQFETFALSAEGGLFAGHLTKGEDGEYLNYAAQCYWLFWQASREAVVVHLPQPFVGDDFTMYDGKEICAAIEAQGLKVAP
ncbi:hypothetical protein Q1Z72_19575 [Pseudomonas qingdaonensis]|uniref:hypothetical protein n=1 Tax=Pseudomonas qingdaonensis TaxID=2056231 RepID=UPI00265F6C44|nr:hypothetical protein [Pseudomonas qingdaonensis]WKL65490.1 hypothetical protein Q1Z72_19575 [Pseudomonas qingdaonensis]